MALASIESVARSRAYTTPRRPGRSFCACCSRVRDEGHIVHHTLGRLCVWCSRDFDYSLTATFERPRDEDSCPLCADGGCPLHND